MTTIPGALSNLRLALTFLFALALAACSGSAGFDLAALQNLNINNFRAPQGATLSTGQPTAARGASLADRPTIADSPTSSKTLKARSAKVPSTGVPNPAAERWR